MKSILTALIFLAPLSAFCQLKNQVNLDDVEIKGEAQGAKGLGVSNRKKNDLAERVKIKSNYTEDIVEELPEGFKLPDSFNARSDQQ